MTTSAGRVVVVGGGVIGASCAYYLCRSGWQVTVLDQGEFGRGCSHGNCGFVCPSHVLPLAAPGAVRSAFKALFQPAGPLSIKLRFDPGLWAWLARFAGRCNLHDMLEAGRAIKALLDSSRALYEELFKQEPFDCEWQTRGLLFVLQTPGAMEHFGETDRLLHEHFGVGARRLDAGALVALEPALKPGLAGGWYYERDGHLRPDKLMTSWRRVLEARGVVIRPACAVQAIVPDRGLASAVATSQGEIPAEAFVVATGAWTPLLRQSLGCRVPIQPAKGYSLTMPRPARCPVLPLIFEEHRVAVTPMASGYRLGSTMEFAGYDTTLNPRRLAYLKAAAAHYLHEPCSEPIQEEWYGWRPMTYDGKPVIDRSPTRPNVVIAAGHNMLGLSMAPATGQLVADLLNRETPHLDTVPFSARRF
jgi:D-amino-acid dehydrogenase